MKSVLIFILGSIWGMWFYHDAAPIYAKTPLRVSIPGTAILLGLLIVFAWLVQWLEKKIWH